MPTALEWMEFFYPSLFDNLSDIYAFPGDVNMALSVGQAWRPKCLSDDQQNQAQAHYAAYVLQFRRLASASGVSADQAAAMVVSGPIVEKQEGSTRVKYRDAAGSSGSAQVAQQATGPGTAYSAWQTLWAACVVGTIDPTTNTLIRRGGIITRYGLPV